MIIEKGLCPYGTKRMRYQDLRYCLYHDDVIKTSCPFRSIEKTDIVSEQLVKDLSLSRCLFLGEMHD